MSKVQFAIVGVVLLAATSFVTPSIAASDDLVEGTVTKVDQSASKITIKHGPIKKFGMDEGMTMVFRADKPELLNNIKAGDKIRFVPDRINGQFTLTKIEKAW